MQPLAVSPEVPAFLGQTTTLGIVQRKELLELFGVETRNKYSVHMPDGTEVAFAAEQGKGFLAAIARYFIGHWRTFQIAVFDPSRQTILVAEHPFRIFFQRLEVSDARGRPLGAIQRRWGLFTKAFDVLDEGERTLLTVRAPFWRIWTFRFMQGGQEKARVEKKWSGFLTELFTDADRFGVTFDASLTPKERALVLMAALYIDLLYFENNQGTGGSSLLDVVGD